jgi:hypothetical protein
LNPPWRAFELLIARIERLLSHADVIIRSPDFIEDRVTNAAREVDVSIRSKTGSAGILITIEGRNRSEPQDVTWIEQLETKRNDIRAAHTIAVSSSGFTKAAIEKALHCGMSLRRIDEISDDEITNWARQIDLSVLLSVAEARDLKVSFYGAFGLGKLQFTPGFEEQWKRLGIDAPIFRKVGDGTPRTIGSLIQELSGSKITNFEDVRKFTLTPGVRSVDSVLDLIFDETPTDGSKLVETCSLEFPPKWLQAETNLGMIDVHKLSLKSRRHLKSGKCRLKR